MIDVDNSFTYSAVKFLAVKTRQNAYITGSNFVIEGLPPGTKQIVIYNATGLSCLKQQVLPSQTKAAIDISRLINGIYLATWNNGGVIIGTTKFVKK